MFHRYPVQTPICINAIKPSLYPRVEMDRCSIGSQILPVQNNLSPRQIQHLIHIGRITVHIIIFSKIIGLLPEFSYIGPN